MKIINLSAVIILVVFMPAEKLLAETCQEVCSMAQENGIKESRNDENTVRCCCINYENRPETECRFD